MLEHLQDMHIDCCFLNTYFWSGTLCTVCKTRWLKYVSIQGNEQGQRSPEWECWLELVREEHWAYYSF